MCEGVKPPTQYFLNLTQSLSLFSYIVGKGQSSDLAAVLNDLSEDVRYGKSNGSIGEIFNPFTPVISPMDGPPSRIDKVYIQTSSGYRVLDNNHFLKSPLDLESAENR